MFRSNKASGKNRSSKQSHHQGLTPITNFFQSKASSSLATPGFCLKKSPSSRVLPKGLSPSTKVSISPDKIVAMGSRTIEPVSSTSSQSQIMGAKKNLFDSLSQPVVPSTQTSSQLSRLKRGLSDGFEDEDDIVFVAQKESNTINKASQQDIEYIKQTKKRRTMVQNFKPPSLSKSNSSSSSTSSFASLSSRSTTQNSFGSHSKVHYSSTASLKPISGAGPAYNISSEKSVSSSPYKHNFPAINAIKAVKKNSILSSSTVSSTGISGFTDENGIKFTKEQKTVLDYIVRDNLNVFYTGSAGTGKSIVLKAIIKRLRMKYGPGAVAVCASTGLASVNIGGITIHKFCGFGIGNGSLAGLAAMVKRNRASLQRWRDTRVLIIDEISMIDGSFLDKLDFVARQVLKNEKPFGGIQIVLTGDFFQLPPINRNKDQVKFCFQSAVWTKAIHKTILFKQVFRQKDNDLIDMLNEIRYGENVSQKTMQLIRSLDRPVYYDDNIEPTELYPTRFEVLKANTRRMEMLQGESRVFKSINVLTADDPTQKKKQLDQLNNSFLVEDELHLKENAQVMMVKNMDEELVNGTVGIVLFFTTEDLYTRSINIYKGIDKDTYIKEMRLISKCCDLQPTEDTPVEVLNYIISGSDLVRTRMEFLIAKARQPKSASAAQSSNLLPLVKFSLPNNRSRNYLVQKQDFKIEMSKSNRDNYIARHQLPLILCYAISIHKAQGQTIQRLKVDLKKVFEVGQIYVALSRAVSKDSLEIKNFNISQLKANDMVKVFYKSLESIHH